MTIGKWIIVAFILFGAFIATLVTVCMKQDINLVSKDYYKDELAYQQQIARVENTLNLSEKPVIAVHDGNLNVTFAKSLEVQTGDIQLFCPSNPAMDRTFSLSGAHDEKFSVKELRGGLYRARMKWTMQGKEYYQEQVIYL